MMPTLHVHRLLIVVPLNRIAAVAGWIQANVDSTCPNNIGPALCSVNDPAQSITHRWQSAAWTDQQCRQILFRLCDLAGVAKPTLAQWNGWNGAQKRTWLVSIRNSILSGYGIYIQLSRGDGDWDNSQNALDSLGLTTVTGV